MERVALRVSLKKWKRIVEGLNCGKTRYAASFIPFSSFVVVILASSIYDVYDCILLCIS